jgi:hypothetical protein
MTPKPTRRERRRQRQQVRQLAQELGVSVPRRKQRKAAE